MAVDMFLDLPEIPGESKKKDHEGQWDLESFNFGVAQRGTFQMGGTGGGTGKAEFQDVSVVKYVDKASPMIFQACAAGSHFDKATIYVRKAGENPMEYLKIEMEHLIISHMSNSCAAAGDKPLESLSINCAKVTHYYTEQQDDGSKGSVTQAGFDLRAGEKV